MEGVRLVDSGRGLVDIKGVTRVEGVIGVEGVRLVEGMRLMVGVGLDKTGVGLDRAAMAAPVREDNPLYTNINELL